MKDPDRGTHRSVPHGEEGLDRLDDEAVVIELGQAGDRYGPDTAGAPHQDGEGAAVGGVVRRVQSGVFVEGPAVDPELFANAERGTAVAVDHGALASKPAVVVR